MTALKVKASALSFLVRRYYRRKSERKNIRRWYQRHQLLDADLDRNDRVDWIAMFIVVMLNVAMWGWYFYYAYKAAPYVWPAR